MLVYTGTDVCGDCLVDVFSSRRLCQKVVSIAGENRAGWPTTNGTRWRRAWCNTLRRSSPAAAIFAVTTVATDSKN